MRTIYEMVAQAIGDPGSITPRIDGETVTQWSARAVAVRALTSNGALRARLQVADDLLHEANGIIFSAENLKLRLPRLSSHCVEGDHVRDLSNPIPIGDQDWRDAAKVWATRWHGFMDSDPAPSDQEAGQ